MEYKREGVSEKERKEIKKERHMVVQKNNTGQEYRRSGTQPLTLV
jgi:hypothetical protein